MSDTQSRRIPNSLSDRPIRQIARALEEVGEFGEVRLIKAKGKLRFIQKVTSEEVWNEVDEMTGSLHERHP